MDRTIFWHSVDEAARAQRRSARDVVYDFDALYRHNNRGDDIGGWRVLRFEPGFAELEKTTTHHCVMEQGILSEALSSVGCSVTVTQTRCLRRGADCCVFRITSSITDARWTGA